MARHPNCQGRTPHSQHTLNGPGGNKPGSRCDGEAGRTIIGTVSEARDALGLPDAAAVWEQVAAGSLLATREPERPGWTISEAPL